MKIKGVLAGLIAFLAIALISCNDDLNTVGGNLRPDGDSIYMGVDSVSLSAKTISLNNTIYAANSIALIGKYEDKVFGETFSDYLGEFYWPTQTKFDPKAFSISSVQLKLYASGFIGDSTKLVGLTAYEINNPLEEDYYTNLDPSKYTDLSNPVAKGGYIYEEASEIGSGISGKIISLEADTMLGRNLLDAWKQNPANFKDKNKFRELFRGLYVTTTFGEGNLLAIGQTSLDINYKFVGRNVADDADSTRTARISIDVTPDIIQLNRVKNALPEDLLKPDSRKSYVRTPAGLCTEINIPLDKILDIVEDRTINSSSFILKGFSEEEELLGEIIRPAYLLFINRDSIANFFEKGKLTNEKSSFIFSRKSDNTYSSLIRADNLSSLIAHYRDRIKKEELNITELNYVMLPVSVELIENTAVVTRIHNQMFPTSAIFRTDPKNLQMKIIHSKYMSDDKKK